MVANFPSRWTLLVVSLYRPSLTIYVIKLLVYLTGVAPVLNGLQPIVLNCYTIDRYLVLLLGVAPKLVD